MDQKLVEPLLTENPNRFVMFPIQDKQGRVVGFGGRTLDDSNPKYLNTSQSPIFDKSKNLYGFNHAYDTIRKQKTVVIVEGYMVKKFLLSYK